jgi:hypothetical protein
MPVTPQTPPREHKEVKKTEDHSFKEVIIAPVLLILTILVSWILLLLSAQW